MLTKTTKIVANKYLARPVDCSNPLEASNQLYLVSALQHTCLILIGTYETRFQDDLFQIEFIVKCATAAKIGGCTDCLGICITK